MEKLSEADWLDFAKSVEKLAEQLQLFLMSNCSQLDAFEFVEKGIVASRTTDEIRARMEVTCKFFCYLIAALEDLKSHRTGTIDLFSQISDSNGLTKTIQIQPFGITAVSYCHTILKLSNRITDQALEGLELLAPQPLLLFEQESGKLVSEELFIRWLGSVKDIYAWRTVFSPLRIDEIDFDWIRGQVKAELDTTFERFYSEQENQSGANNSPIPATKCSLSDFERNQLYDALELKNKLSWAEYNNSPAKQIDRATIQRRLKSLSISVDNFQTGEIDLAHLAQLIKKTEIS